MPFGIVSLSKGIINVCVLAFGKKYICSCGKSYTFITNLRRHEKECGNSNKKFSCNYCHHLTHRLDSLKKHMSRRHSDLPEKTKFTDF